MDMHHEASPCARCADDVRAPTPETCGGNQSMMLALYVCVVFFSF